MPLVPPKSVGCVSCFVILFSVFFFKPCSTCFLSWDSCHGTYHLSFASSHFYLTRINCRLSLIYFLIIWSLLFLLLQLPFHLNRLVYRRHLSPFCSLSSFKNINKLNPKARATTSITRTIWTRKKKATVQTAKLWQMSLYEVESRRVAFGIEAKSRTWEHAWRFVASRRHVMWRSCSRITVFLWLALMKDFARQWKRGHRFTAQDLYIFMPGQKAK